MTEFGSLAYPEVERLIHESPRPLLLLPLGAVEPHGPHAPLATDLAISLGICRRQFRSRSCHAGRYETSLVLAEEPATVHRDRMRALPPRMVDMPAGIAAGRTDFLALGMDEAYCGAPAEATADEGEQTFETLTDMLVALVREVARP